jgi:hypothetical protein
MRFDLQKIDERIKKLQEIRRLAVDPEAASLLLEFMSTADERSVSASAVKMDANGATTHPHDSKDMVQEVVTTKEAASGSGLWTRTRG